MPVPPSDEANSVLERWEPVIGLEVHCQLNTESKLFCGCSTKFGALPNHHACPVCLGHPGVLPVLNEKAVDHAVRLAMALGAELRPVSVFARKQYFYPDLPKGYQITQYDLPYCFGGGLKISSGFFVPLTRIHIEEDAGKNIHEGTASYVDANRAGTPLVEIVSEPALHSAEDAADYLRRLRSLVRHLDISDGNMEEGSFRCDANVSLRRRGANALGTRAEIKNLNSFKNIERAIRYEIFRQADLLESGEKIVQQTLLFDAASGRTQPMRSKEESHDYRYFPDPDLGALRLSDERIARIKNSMPELPEAMAVRYRDVFGLSDYDAELLTADRDLARYFERVVKAAGANSPPKIAANWILTELMRVANEREWNIASPPLPPERLGELLALIADDTISGRIAKTVFEQMVETGKAPALIVKEKGLVQVTDAGAIKTVIAKIIAASPGQVAEFQSGKEKVFGYFVGQVMREGQGKLNPALVNTLLRAALKGD